MSNVLPLALVSGLLLAVPLLLAPSVAVNPLDDDAGSGGDAGDHPAVATPIEPGYLEGRLAGPHDRVDWYRFEGRFGDYVVFDVTSDAGRLVPLVLLRGPSDVEGVPGDLYRVGYGGYVMAFLLPEDGTWYLSLEVNAADPSTTNYGVDFSVEHREGVQSLIMSDPSVVFELDVEEAGDVWVWIRARTVETSLDGPSATTLLHDTGLSAPNSSFIEGSGGMRLWRAGTGDAWQVDERGVEGELPVDVVAPTASGSFGAVLDLQEATGFMRFVAYFTGHEGEVDLVFWTDGEATWGAGPAGNVTSYRTGDLNTGSNVLLPGLDPGGPRALDVVLPARSVGWAAGGGAPVTAVDPHGTVYESRDAPADFLPFYYPPAGDWSFSFDPPVHVGDRADRIWFDHVQVPDLDVAAWPWNPLPE